MGKDKSQKRKAEVEEPDSKKERNVSFEDEYVSVFDIPFIDIEKINAKTQEVWLVQLPPGKDLSYFSTAEKIEIDESSTDSFGKLKVKAEGVSYKVALEAPQLAKQVFVIGKDKKNKCKAVPINKRVTLVKKL
uniref:Uncharacterized protein n=1 Tax=Polytomella parva TaxID=51329 RepID=A0A7S0YDF8_9CHLO|mmetsp:Transcript_11230/g.20333  ORF Transcript_11230/g.20333 Transcript_11230/m.20333 type:complete len:133 (+) Transcript_11230:45-443(+)